jgi:hypothetical protein
MIGYLADRAVWSAGRGFFRLLRRQRQQSVAQNQGKRSPAWTWPYILILPSGIGAVANTALGNTANALWLWGLTLLCVLLTAAGVHSQHSPGAAGSAVLAKYQPLPDVMSPEDMRTRAKLLEYVEAAEPETGHITDETQSSDAGPGHMPNETRSRSAGPGGASASWHLDSAVQRQTVLDGLYSVACPEPQCKAAVTVPCNMGIAVPVLLVSRKPVLFCHVSRAAAAVAAGTAEQDDVIARVRAGSDA